MDISLISQHQPISVRESSCAAHPLALLLAQSTILLQQITTIFLSLHHLCFRDTGSGVSEWELRERREREEEREAEAEELGAAEELGFGGELPLLLPTPLFMAPAGEE